MYGKIRVEIDQEKVKLSVLWDGLKGYLTNADLPVDIVIESYGQL